jgi:hypothetical protein
MSRTTALTQLGAVLAETFSKVTSLPARKVRVLAQPGNTSMTEKMCSRYLGV